ncbi:MAG: TonB-dependent siderophore receptor [Hyphomicrobiales bacterium]|nr:TonB-dependent siderophore receptor [Hyphomicrobiales bacterium]
MFSGAPPAYAQVALEGIIIEGELAPGASNGPRNSVDGYKAATATSATKTNTPIERIPQSIQVIPRAVIEDQKSLSVEEALRNVSGVQAAYPLQTPAYDSTLVRGFAAEQWLDGLAVYYNPGDRDSLVNVERIEVLKGPSALLYGGGAGAPVGGAVNVVSKLPTETAGGEFGVTFGSHNYFKPYFDINQPLSSDGTVLFRITGEYKYAESFIDVIETETYNLNPTIVFTNKTDTTLTIQGKLSSWEQPEYQGLPATGTVTGGFDIDRDLFIGPADIEDSYSRYHGVTATLDHRFDAMWSASVKARYSRTEFEENVQTIVGADSFQANAPFIPPSTWALANVELFQQVEEFTINPSLLAEFDVGGAKTKALFGFDYSRLTDDAFLAGAFLPGSVDLTNPIFFPYDDPTAAQRFQDAANVYETRGVYAQVQTELWNRLHLLGGVRAANVTIESFDATAGTDDTTDESRLLPRAGALLEIMPGFSVFASYSEGLKGNPFVNFQGTPKAEESQQREVGVKFNLAHGLSGTLAVFEIDRINTPIAAPGGLFSVAEGEEQSRGFEADLIWQPSPNWRFLASYAYTEAEYVKDAGAAQAGNSLVGAPEHAGRLWANYTFTGETLKGWSVGAGIYLASEQFVDAANLYELDGYFTVDAKIAYETERYAASLAFKNLTDEEYFVQYDYFNGRVAPADGLAVYGSVSFKY